MRAVFRRAGTGAELVIARAETIPVRAGSIDAVVAAQAFHWFRQPDTLLEILRVLRTSGGIGLVWNRRDESIPWMKRLGALIDSEAGETPRSHWEEWRKPFDEIGGFEPIETRSFPYAPRLTREGVVDRVLSISAIGLLPPERQQGLALEVRKILAEEPSLSGQEEIEFPYRTDTYVAVRRPAAAGATGAAQVP
jgi:SAM-dependent methyltransferase